MKQNKISPEVPDEVTLPAWLDPAGLARPGALEGIRSECARHEERLIDIIGEVAGLLHRAAVLHNAAYVACSDQMFDDDAQEVPGDVLAAVTMAVGVRRVMDLLGALTDYSTPEMGPTTERRAELIEQVGLLPEWSSEAKDESDRLGGIAA